MAFGVESSGIAHRDHWDWELAKDIESFLLDRAGGPGTVTVYDYTDSHGGMIVESVAQAEARTMAEGTTPSGLSFTVMVDAFERHASLGVEYDDYGGEGTYFRLNFRDRTDDRWTRGLKVDFDAWLKRWEEAHKPPPEPDPPEPIVVVAPAPRGPWWKPDLHSVRDNLLASVLWLVLGLVVVGGVAVVLGR